MFCLIIRLLCIHLPKLSVASMFVASSVVSVSSVAITKQGEVCSGLIGLSTLLSSTPTGCSSSLISPIRPFSSTVFPCITLFPSMSVICYIDSHFSSSRPTDLSSSVWKRYVEVHYSPYPQPYLLVACQLPCRGGSVTQHLSDIYPLEPLLIPQSSMLHSISHLQS